MTQPLLRKLRAWQMEVIKSENIMLTVKFIRLLYYVIGAMFPSALENVSYQNVLPYLFMLVELGGLLESSVETNVPRMQQPDILNHHQQPTSVTSGNELNGTRSPCSKEDQELNYVMPTQQGSLTPRAGSEMLGFSSGHTMLAYRGDEDPMEYTISSPTAASGHCPHPPLPAPATFFIDSGASNHVTGNKELFTYQGHSEIEKIYLADGRALRVAGVGLVTSAGINLPRVLHVDGMTCNILVSVSQLTRDHAVKVVFEREYVTIKELGSERTVGQGYVKDGMYHLDRLSLPGVTNPASS